MGRTLKFNVFRFNPEDSASVPHMDAYYLEETDAMTLFIALNRIREEQDPTLMFDFMCRAGICGSCAMMINGRPDLACHTKTKALPNEITLMPLPVFKLIGDLSVDTGTWFRGMNEKVQSWVHTTRKFDPQAEEERMDNTLADEIYELERCIECGCCVAACGKANMLPDTSEYKKNVTRIPIRHLPYSGLLVAMVGRPSSVFRHDPPTPSVAGTGEQKKGASGICGKPRKMAWGQATATRALP